jgi:hypothetical protein
MYTQHMEFNSGVKASKRQSINRSINQSINRSVSQSVNQSMNQSPIHSPNQSLNPLFYPLLYRQTVLLQTDLTANIIYLCVIKPFQTTSLTAMSMNMVQGLLEQLTAFNIL